MLTAETATNIITFIITQIAASSAKGKRSVLVSFCIVCNNNDESNKPINSGTLPLLIKSQILEHRCRAVCGSLGKL